LIGFCPCLVELGHQLEEARRVADGLGDVLVL
jgi:hypothetical protein